MCVRLWEASINESQQTINVTCDRMLEMIKLTYKCGSSIFSNSWQCEQIVKYWQKLPNMKQKKFVKVGHVYEPSRSPKVPTIPSHEQRNQIQSFFKIPKECSSFEISSVWRHFDDIALMLQNTKVVLQIQHLFQIYIHLPVRKVEIRSTRCLHRWRPCLRDILLLHIDWSCIFHDFRHQRGSAWILVPSLQSSQSTS